MKVASHVPQNLLPTPFLSPAYKFLRHQLRVDTIFSLLDITIAFEIGLTQQLIRSVMMGMVIVLAVALMVAAPAAYAASYTVGDDSGWDTGVTYSDWTAGKTFTVGDTLVFKYQPIHAVDVVSASDYKSCSSASPIKSYSGSPTTITLSTAGPWYFICPTSNHCANGQALSTTVLAATTPSPPGVSASPPPPGTSTTTTAPPPPPSSSTSPPPPPPPSSTSSPPPPAGKAGALAISSLTSFVCFVSVIFLSV